VLSSRAVDDYQMYFGGSIVGKASTIGIEISLTPPLIFIGRGVKKCEIWHRVQHHSILQRPRLKMQQDIQTLKQKCNAAMIALYVLTKFGEVGFTHT